MGNIEMLTKYIAIKVTNLSKLLFFFIDNIFWLIWLPKALPFSLVAWINLLKSKIKMSSIEY